MDKFALNYLKPQTLYSQQGMGTRKHVSAKKTKPNILKKVATRSLTSVATISYLIITYATTGNTADINKSFIKTFVSSFIAINPQNVDTQFICAVRLST